MEEVSLLKVNSYQDNLPAQINKLLEPLGGLPSFCGRGDRVLLKPNFIMARSIESAATTHPKIILAMVKLLKDIGCEVAVGDSPGVGSSAGVINRLGLANDLKHFAVKVIDLNTLVSVNMNRSRSFERRFKNLQLAGELGEFDKIINLPKLKAHGQMGISLATKNLFGCVPGHNKAQWHYAIGDDLSAFGRLLVEIALSVNADLHLLDGIIGMDGNGPSNGRPRNFGLLLAGRNPIAVDRVIVEMIQQKPDYFPIFKAAELLKIQGVQLSEIEVKGDSIAGCRIEDFELPAFRDLDLFDNKVIGRFVSRLLRQHLILDQTICTSCRKCETSCPAKAIEYKQKILINEKKCIRCCCCQEMCPVGALSVKTPVFVKLLRKLGMM